MSKHKRIPKTLSEDQIRAYQEGKLSDRDSHEVERTAFDSDFDQDALDGLSQNAPEIWQKDLQTLRSKLSSQKGRFPLFQIAAIGSILILTSISLWYFTRSKEENLAYQEAPKEEKALPVDEEGPKEVELVEKHAEPEEAPLPPAPEKVELATSKPDIETEEKQSEQPLQQGSGNIPKETPQALADDSQERTLTEVDEDALSEVVAEPSESVAVESFYDTKEEDRESAPLPMAAPASRAKAADAEDAAREEVRKRINVTGAVSRSAAAPTTCELLDCTGEDGYNGKSFICASPQNGMEAYSDYIQLNKKLTGSGSVLLSLTIAEFGAMEKVEILKSTNENLNEEALRLIKEGPNWVPATWKGDAVSATVVIAVSFIE